MAGGASGCSGCVISALVCLSSGAGGGTSGGLGISCLDVSGGARGCGGSDCT